MERLLSDLTLGISAAEGEAEGSGAPSFPLFPAERFSLARQAFSVGKVWIFKAWRVYPSDVCRGQARISPSGPWFIVRMSPSSYPSAWLLPSRARFRFTG